MTRLSGSARDVEPLVDARIDWRRSLVLALGDVESAWVNAVWAVGNGAIGAASLSVPLHTPRNHIANLQIDVTRLSLASNKLLPRLSAFPYDLHSILLVLALARKRKLVLRLAIRDLVDSEPLIRRPQQTRQMSLDVLDVVELWCERIVDIDDDDLPVRLAFV